MSKKPKPRRIIVNEIEYRWSLDADDYDYASVFVSILVTTPSPLRSGHKNALRFTFSRATLILPSFIRQLILDAHAAGWHPFNELPSGFSFRPTDGAYPDIPDPKKPPLVRSSEQIEEDLLCRIRESPNDNSPRLVYADWLQERGDLRGEYIHLACMAADRASNAKALSPEEDARMRALFDEHQWKWLGPVGDLTQNRRWARGLVEDVVLGRRARGVVDRGIGDIGWRTVRRLDTRGAFLAASDIVRIVSHPVLRDLDALATTFDVLSDLLKADAVPDVEELTVTIGETATSFSLAATILQDVLSQPRAGGRRRLRRLLISDLGGGAPRDALLQAMNDPALSLIVSTSLARLDDWQDALNRVPSLHLASLHITRGFTVMFAPLHFEAIFRQDPRTMMYSRLDIHFTDVDDPWSREQICDGILGLPPTALSVLSVQSAYVDKIKWNVSEWLANVRDGVREQRDVSFEGLLIDNRLATVD